MSFRRRSDLVHGRGFSWRSGVIPLAVLLVAACTAATPSSVPSNRPVTSATPPPAATSAATQPPTPAATPSSGAAAGVCALFTTDEIAALIGQSVGPGTLGGPLDSDCEWPATGSDTSYVLIQKVPGSYFEDHASEAGYHAISGIGDRASVSQTSDGGLDLAVLAGQSGYYVDVIPSPNEQTLIDFGREFITRSP